MLRKRINSLLTEPTKQDRLVSFLRLLVIIGVLWLVSFPFIAQDIFISENALDARQIQPSMSVGETAAIFNSMRADLS